MAKLPDFTDLGARPEPRRPHLTPTAGFRGTSGFEGEAAAVLQHAGAQLEEGASAAFAAKEHQDTLRAEDAFNQLRQAQAALTYGDRGFANVKGADAVSGDLQKNYGDQFGAAAQAISGTLDNDYQRQLFQRRASIANTDFQGDIARHVTVQREQYAGDVLQGTVATESELASRNPDMAPTAAVRIDAAIKNYAQQFGKPQEWVDEKKTVAKSQLFSKVIEQTIDADPVQAEALFRTYADHLTPNDRVVVGHRVQTAVLPVQAKNIADSVMQDRPATSRDARAMLGPWLADAEKAANEARPNDPVFRDMVLQQVRGHVSNIVAALEGQQAAAQGVLLQVTSGGPDGKQRKPTTLDELFSIPGARNAYTMLDPQAANGIQNLLQHNAYEAERGAPVRSDAKVVSDLFQKIHLDDNDPRKITRPEQLTPFFAHGLNRADYDWLKREMVEAQTPEGSPFKKDVQSARNTARFMLLRSRMGQLQPDQAEEAAYRFNRALDAQIDNYRKAGKDPQLLLTPGTSDYALAPEKVGRFLTSMQLLVKQTSDKIRDGQALPLSEQPAPVANVPANAVQPPMKGAAMDTSAFKVGTTYKFEQGAFVYKGGDVKDPHNWDVPDYDKIPAGTRYLAPDGNVYTKGGTSAPQTAGGGASAAPAVASAAVSPAEQPAQPPKPKEELKVPELVDDEEAQTPTIAKYAKVRKGMERGKAKAEIQIADFNVKLAEHAIARFDDIVSAVTAPARLLIATGQAIGQAIPTDLESSVSNFRALVQSGTFRTGSAPIITTALASGALSKQEEQIAKAMLQQIAAKGKRQ